MDIDTADGMAEAVKWQSQFLELMGDGGKWGVPRSESIYEVHPTKKIAIRERNGEEEIDRVFKAMGWEVKRGVMSYMDAPSDEIFNEIKSKAIEIWQTYDDTYGYASEKIAYVESITNVRDNWGTIVGMFDYTNQAKLLAKLSPGAINKVKEWL